MLRVQPYPGFEQQSKMQNSEASEDLHGLRGGKKYVYYAMLITEVLDLYSREAQTTSYPAHLR